MVNIEGKKVILCGYNWAGCKALEQLVAMGCRVFVCTHVAPPDLPDLLAYAKTIEVPAVVENINDVRLPFEPDYLCSIYYRFIIKKPLLERVGGKAFNLHPSLLPKYRGCSSLTWAMVNGDEYAGYTYHYIDEGCDTGNIILQRPVRIEPFDTQLNLYQRVMFQAMLDFPSAMAAVIQEVTGHTQTGEVSYFRRGAPYYGVINPDWDDAFISRFIRAMKSLPYPYARLAGEEVFSIEQFHTIKKRLMGDVNANSD